MDILSNNTILIELRNIAQKYNLSVLILFGSRANQKHKKDSDYDFAFYTKKRINIKDEMRLFEDLMSLMKTEKIDLININTNHSPILRNEIFQKGVCLYEEKKSLFSQLKGAAFIDYIDFQRFEKNRLNLLRKDIEESLA